MNVSVGARAWRALEAVGTVEERVVMVWWRRVKASGKYRPGGLDPLHAQARET
jgi:hypothetical protein